MQRRARRLRPTPEIVRFRRMPHFSGELLFLRLEPKPNVHVLSHHMYTLLERRQVFEYLRDRAGEHYQALTGSAWRPRSGSLVNHAKLTASLLESREYLSAKRRYSASIWVRSRIASFNDVPQPKSFASLGMFRHRSLTQDRALLRRLHPVGRLPYRLLLRLDANTVYSALDYVLASEASKK